jgi:hypothetical protein
LTFNFLINFSLTLKSLGGFNLKENHFTKLSVTFPSVFSIFIKVY